MRGTFGAIALIMTILTSMPTAASAKPLLKLSLAGEIVSKDAKGQEQATPVDAASMPAPGQTLRYVITATNKGDEAARNVIPVGKIPRGTIYKSGSASSDSTRVEFSLNGGKTWAAQPKVTVHTPTGDVVKLADPSTYTAVRWLSEKPLAPQASTNYSYEVQVK